MDLAGRFNTCTNNSDLEHMNLLKIKQIGDYLGIYKWEVEAFCIATIGKWCLNMGRKFEFGSENLKYNLKLTKMEHQFYKK